MYMKQAILFLTIFSLFILPTSGCASQNDETYIKLCADALFTLSSQKEYHYTSYTLEGETIDTMSSISSTEYWVSGSDWLSFNASLNLWEMSKNSIYYTALSQSKEVMWQLADSELITPSPVPEVDFNIYSFESVTTVNNTEVIILSSNGKPVSQGVITSDEKMIFTFSESGDLMSYEYRFSITADESDSPIFYSMLIEYHTFEQGDIERIIQNKYCNAINNIE